MHSKLEAHLKCVVIARYFQRPWWDREGHGRQASAIPTHGDQCETWGGPTA